MQGGRGRSGGAPPLTPLGKQLNDKMLPWNIQSGRFVDPFVRSAIPWAFPGTRATRCRDDIRRCQSTFVLIMFMNIWREIERAALLPILGETPRSDL